MWGELYTADVMEWISSLGYESLRIGYKSEFLVKKLILSSVPLSDLEFSFEINGNEYSLDQIKSFWYRRGNLRFLINLKSTNYNQTDDIQIANHLQAELDSLRRTIYSLLETRKGIGKESNSTLDKISVLILAKSIGIDIPETLITSFDNELIKQAKRHESLITKSISDGLSITDKSDKTQYSGYTEEVNVEAIKPNFVRFPSLVQEKLNKYVELRIFYFDHKCYSMAIFSQADKQTSTDFRKYNNRKPNRIHPFRLPELISDKLILLMKKLNLNSGSIDMILTTSGRYVFLEINPVGQFGMVSKLCNYRLEKLIAEYLVTNERGI